MKMDLPVEHEKPSPKRSIDSMNYDEAYRDLICNEADGEKEEKDLCKKQKKKNVIILTPPIHPINSPKIPDLGLNLEWLWIDYLFIIEDYHHRFYYDQPYQSMKNHLEQSAFNSRT